MKHSEIYRGRTLTCLIESHGDFVKWECHIDGKQSVAGISSSTATEFVPSGVLSEAFRAGRRAIDRSLEELRH